MPDNLPYDEKELLEKIAAGDEKAFKSFFKHYWKKILANAQQFTKHPELAEDLAQEVFLKIWINRSNLTQVNSLEGYLYSVAKNLFLDHLKKKVLNISNIEYLQEWFHDHLDTASKKLETKELEGAINEAVNRLPPQMKKVFLLSRVEGLTHEQIAKKLLISKATSQSYIVRALIVLKKILMEKGQLDDGLLLFLMSLQFILLKV